LSTENVVVLFTDMVSSTALASSMEPDAADELRREHYAILRQALAATGGTEVKNTGDGVMAAFTSASSALACGVEMQQGVDRNNRVRGHTIGLRIGLSGGEVTPDEGDYFGEPVVEAARLCAACRGGQILAAQVVVLLAGRRNPHQYRVIGPVDLAGLPDPVETAEVLWEPLADLSGGGAIPLPRRLAFRPAVGVVGRETEIATIEAARQRVVTDAEREVILVSGEPGLGKTTLVAEAARNAAAAGACVLFGHCEDDLAVPYQLFAESLGHYGKHAPPAHLLEHVERHGSGLARLVPALSDRISALAPSPATDADTERYLLVAAAIGLIAEISTRSVLVLVLDDLQWADAESLSLLRHLAAAEQQMPLLILGTFRDSELPQADKLRDTLGVLHRHRGVSRIDLSGLDDAAVVSFVEAAAGHDLDEDGVELAHALYRETDGNPFFVSEVLRHLSETGAIKQDDRGRWGTADGSGRVPLPDSVREVIGGRVARLGSQAERVLPVAAVMGREFDFDVLMAATDLDEDELLDVLDAARGAALVREVAGSPGRYTFAHALIQQTMYDDLGPTRRARAHRHVALALEARPEDPSASRARELARHWINATQPIDLPKAIGYSRRAGDVALAALAPAEALLSFDQALELCADLERPDPILLLDLAIGRGTAQRQLGDSAFRETLLDAAQQATALGDTERLVAAALANDRGFYSAVGATDAEKVSVLELASKSLSGQERERALVLATLCSELTHGSSLDHREALANEAVAIAER
jgi:predicted ATPase/class 3 adenylate cyclase